MVYFNYMNKDIIYIEPEDDITDIITKIENAKEKIVALVPPKKAGVFRSVVNIKLIAKAGTTAEKTVVIVTTDPSIVKIAGMVRVLVTKNLQSVPAIPRDGDFEENSEVAEVSEDKSGAVVAGESSGETEDAKDEGEAEKEPEEAADAEDEGAVESSEEQVSEEENDADDDEEDDEGAGADEKSEKASGKTGKKAKKESKFLKNAKNPVLVWVREHTKLAAGLAVGLVALIALGIWAFVFAPAATITVGVRTTNNNFSENVTFTETLAEEDTAAGKFYLTQYKIEETVEKEFEATGTKEVGEKATGSVVIYAFFRSAGAIAIDSGSSFSINSLSYVANEEASLAWDGQTVSQCDNQGQASMVLSGCQVSARVSVTAAGPGTRYNISAASSGWTTTANVNVYSDAAMTGGTDKTVTVVQQSDIEKVLSEMGVANEQENKAKLLATVPEGMFAVDASFKQTVGEAVTTPKVGETVEEGKKAKLSVATTDTIFAIDKTKVEEFISEKAKLADGFKIYTLNDPFIENFMKAETGYVGKLKASFIAGPKVTENDIVEIVKGKGFGTAQHDLGSVDGIGTIRIDGSYPWVMSIPDNPEKITVVIETKI